MSKTKRTIAVIMSCISICPLAYAEESGWYASADIGWTNFDYFENNIDGFLQLKDDHIAWGATVGFQAVSTLAVELSYADHGTFKGQGFNCPFPAVCIAGVIPARGDLKTIGLHLVPSWPINDRLSLLGKIGASRWDLSSTLSAPVSDDIELVIGAAVRWRFGENLTLQAGYEGAGDRRSLLVGLGYRF